MNEVTARRWSLATRILFRFACAYLVLYNLPFLGALWYSLVPWFSERALSMKITVFPNGSGDTTFNYVQLLLQVGMSVVATIAWSLVDGARPDYERLHDLLRILVRYTLAFTMVGYGVAKVGQFPSPTLDRLQETYGESSPMGLMWTFMGASKAYCFFAGAGEVVGGLLLCSRRTTTLGALICSGVLANVVALDFCYDVPAKLFAAHLLLMALFLALPDARRLANVLVWNLPTEPKAIDWVPRARSARVTKVALKVVLVGVVTMTAWQEWEMEKLGAPVPGLYGIYEVEDFARRGDAVAPLTSDRGVWKSLTLDRYDVATIRLADGSKHYFHSEETLGARLELRSSWTGDRAQAPDGVLAYTRPDADHLVLHGTFEGTPLSIDLRRVDESKFLLVSRGFHWVSEWPFNR